MARGQKQRGSDRNLDQDTAPEAIPGARKKLGPPPKLDGSPTAGSWFEEAWHGWMKPVGGLVLVVVAYFAYTSHFMPEEAAGRIVLVLILGGAIYAGVEPALDRFSDARRRYMMLGAAAVWAIIAVAPVFRTVFPSKVLAETVIGLTKDTTTGSVTVEGGDTGPYSVSVYGRLKGSGEVDAAYEVEITGAGESVDRVSGELKRTYFNQRVSRRGSGTVAVKQENTENVHRLSTARGPQLKVSGEVGSEQLEDGIHVSFRAAGPSPLLFLGVGLLLVIGALVFDYRMAAPKHDRTHLSTAAGFTLAFGAYFPMEATPHNLVRPAIAAVLVGLGLGALVVWVISAIVNSFKPRPKKLAGVNNRFAEE